MYMGPRARSIVWLRRQGCPWRATLLDDAEWESDRLAIQGDAGDWDDSVSSRVYAPRANLPEYLQKFCGAPISTSGQLPSSLAFP